MGEVKYVQDQAQNLQRSCMWGSGLLIYKARSHLCCVLASEILFIYSEHIMSEGFLHRVACRKPFIYSDYVAELSP